jgi:hypothetical protein
MAIDPRVTLLRSAKGLSGRFELGSGDVHAEDLQRQILSFICLDHSLSLEDNLPAVLERDSLQRSQEFEDSLMAFFEEALASQGIKPSKCEYVRRCLDVRLIRNLFFHLVEAVKKDEVLGVPTESRGRPVPNCRAYYNLIIKTLLVNNFAQSSANEQYLTLDQACEVTARLSEILMDPRPTPKALTLKRTFQRSSHYPISGGSKPFKGFRKSEGEIQILYDDSPESREKRRWSSQHDRSKLRP